mgnify:CR=1 FL=1
MPFISTAQTFNYKTDFDSILLRTNEKDDPLFHQKLEFRFNENDTNLSDFEILALLINYTSNSNYAPYEILDDEEKIKEKIDLFQFEEAINLCDSLLRLHPYNQMALFQKSFAFLKLNQLDSAEFYSFKFNRIMDAMAASGNGSVENAIFSLGTKDAENFIYERLTREIMEIGSGLDSNGNFIDIIQITDHQKDTSIIHFQIQHAINQLYKADSTNK